MHFMQDNSLSCIIARAAYIINTWLDFTGIFLQPEGARNENFSENGRKNEYVYIIIGKRKQICTLIWLEFLTSSIFPVKAPVRTCMQTEGPFETTAGIVVNRPACPPAVTNFSDRFPLCPEFPLFDFCCEVLIIDRLSWFNFLDFSWKVEIFHFPQFLKLCPSPKSLCRQPTNARAHKKSWSFG